MDFQRFEEQVFFTTVRITIPRKTAQGASIGTGFLLQAPLNDPKNRSATLLISNKHVYGDPGQSIVLNFTCRDPSDKSKPHLGHTRILQANDFHGVYMEHPDAEVDLACLNISLITDPAQGIFFKTLNPGILADFNEVDLLPGAGVWFVGYPENRYDTTHNLPILRRGYVASIPKVDFNGRKQIVIDAQVFPGSSGSPVFAALGREFKLVGIVAGTMIRHEQLQAVPADVGLGIHQVIGLGIVLKSVLVKELVDFATAKIRTELARAEREPVSQSDEPATPEEIPPSAGADDAPTS